MYFSLRFIPGEGIQRHGMNAVEDGLFNIGVVPFQAPQQRFDLLPLGAASAVVTDGAVLREAAGTLDKFQLIVLPPCDDIFFADAIHGTDELHAVEIAAVELWQHGLQL